MEPGQCILTAMPQPSMNLGRAQDKEARLYLLLLAKYLYLIPAAYQQLAACEILIEPGPNTCKYPHVSHENNSLLTTSKKYISP